MAVVRLFGATFNADVIKDNGDGTWTMRSRAHTGRTSPGTLFTAKHSEIIEMAAAEQPAVPNSPVGTPISTVAIQAKIDTGLAALEAGMAAERKTLPTPAELIAAIRAKNTSPTATPPGRPVYDQPAVSVPPGPTMRP